jgi:sortase (surface protein transpeptidase)
VPAHGRHRARGRAGLFGSHLSLAGLAAIAAALSLAVSLPSAGAPAADVPVADVPAEASDTAGARQIVLTDDASASETSAPVRVRIPSIGVDTRLLRLGVDGDGVLVPPADFARAGWFSGSPVPGDVGPSVIAGHLDSHDGPAVFFRLRDLAPGDEVLVDRADGTTARFTVTGADRYPKNAFPTEEVYGPTHRAELRLITCGGEFDRDNRSYRDNVVVTAVLS